MIGKTTGEMTGKMTGKTTGEKTDEKTDKMIGIGRRDSLITEDEWKGLCDRFIAEELAGQKLSSSRILILPPDITRCYSYAGAITAYLYELLHEKNEVRIMPAVGTHMQMTTEERESFFPGIPAEAFMTHNWKEDCVKLGEVPSELVSKVTDGRCSWNIDVLLNRHLVSGEFDHIISVGQVVPHEVVGLANYTKNLLVGLGGRDMINKTHMVSAICNIETILGNIDSPVRAIFDYAQQKYLDPLGIHFILTVTKENHSGADLYGLYIGKERSTFEAAGALARQVNITWLPERAKKVICWLDPAEFRSTWVGNKAIYRTRMAIADGGELLVIAPGIKQFGENKEVDACIRKYGYSGTEKIISLYEQGAFENLEMVSAHLVHGSSDGRFRITYATDPAKMSKEEIESVGYSWLPVQDAIRKYDPQNRETGYCTIGGEECYLIKAPATGLWRI